MIDKNVEWILGNLPRAAANPYDSPKIPHNAIVFVDGSGRLNILGEFGLLTIDEEDFNVLDAEGYLV